MNTEWMLAPPNAPLVEFMWHSAKEKQDIAQVREAVRARGANACERRAAEITAHSVDSRD